MIPGTFTIPLQIATDDGSTVDVTIDATLNGAGLTVPTGPISAGPAGVSLSVAAATASATEGDTAINVRADATTVTFTLTAISDPEI
jgi:hypothetical protein